MRKLWASLIGGDTIALPDGAPRVLGLTAIGHAGKRVPTRAGQPHDHLWLIGTIGEAAAGLAQLDRTEMRAGRSSTSIDAPCRY